MYSIQRSVSTLLGRLFVPAFLVGFAFLTQMLGAQDTSLGQAGPTIPGKLNPLRIPKYVIPLVIPPVMNDDGASDSYDIAVREFRQQILPGGIWNTINGRNDKFRPTRVWSYGPAADSTPAVAPDPNSQFNYPAYTIEASSGQQLDVRWINDLVKPDGRFRSHLLAVDQTLHWANPPAGPGMTDSVGTDPSLYMGPVPLVTHVHGAHVTPESDGYPEAWWLPAASNIPAGYATAGTLFDDVTGNNPGNLGYADYRYSNDQPATTLWYHDHSLGMTRLNVYAGPAGFWLVRGGVNDGGIDGSAGQAATLPGPAPVAGQGVLELNVPGDPVRSSIREIPIVIQDRSFTTNSSLWYPDDRAYFEGLLPNQLQIDTKPDSDIAPYWVPEAFFDVMVVNGVSWPWLDVAQSLYRFRLLNGCNSRFLNLALVVEWSPDASLIDRELPFYQIGAEQGFIRNPVMITTGFATPLRGNGWVPANPRPAGDPDQALLMALAERADVMVDFRGLPDGTVVRMINTAPDAPFGGFTGDATPGDEEPADPDTTGQVMRFVVDASMTGASDTDPNGATPATDPWSLFLNAEGKLPAADNVGNPRMISLNEEESQQVCVLLDPTTDEYVVPIKQVDCSSLSPTAEGYEVVPFGPKEALLGQVDLSGPDPVGIALKWTTPNVGVRRTVTVPTGNVDVWVTENPDVGAIEEWDIYNFTADAHPIHLHLVRFEVVSRTLFDPDRGTASQSMVQPWEKGFKDTVISYPGQITRVKAQFDIEGLYVWHCHIVEHEDNEMMRPYFVGDGD